MTKNEVRESVKAFVEDLDQHGVRANLIIQMTDSIKEYQNEQYKKMHSVMRHLLNGELLACKTEYDQDMQNELVNQLWAAVNDILGGNGWISCKWAIPQEYETKEGEFDPSDEVLVLLDNGFNKKQKISRYWSHRRSESKEFLKWLDLESWEQERVVGWQPLPGNEMFSAFEIKPFTDDELTEVSMDNIKKHVDKSVENAAMLSELREYRAIGTVEQFRMLSALASKAETDPDNDVPEFVNKMLKEYPEYLALGTVEGIKNLITTLDDANDKLAEKLEAYEQLGTLEEISYLVNQSLKNAAEEQKKRIWQESKIFAYEQFGTPEEIGAAVQFMKLAKKYGTVGRVVEACMEYEEIGDVEEFRKLKELKKELKKELQKHTQPTSFLDHMIAVFDTAKPGDKIDFFEEFEKFMGWN